MHNFKNVCLFILSFFLVNAVQAASIENPSSIKSVTDSQLSYSKKQKLRLQEWYVILGTYAQTKKGYKAAWALSNKLKKRGYDVIVRNSDFYKGLKDELVVVMMGPFHRQKQAATKRNAIKHIIREAYFKQLLYQGD